MADDTPRRFTEETGVGRIGADGREWFACDPYPTTWYRRERGKVIVKNTLGGWADGGNDRDIDLPTPGGDF